MTDQPDSAVRVLDRAGRTAGAGVLVGSQKILTCAHVVNTALGRAPSAQDQPTDEVTVEFAVGGAPPLRARVQRWLPPPRAGAIGDDIAGLVLTSPGLPTGATPARLAVNPPARGRMVDVFGYPGSPPRPHGAWVAATVRGQVTGGHLQLDSTPDSALRIQPGFSGSPVYDRGTGRVVGLLSAAPPAASGDRDSYAITADRLRLAWPEVLGPARESPPDGVRELTILHVSDPRFGRDHLFGGNGLISADLARDILFQRLHDDLDRLAADPGLHPDLMVVTGDLAERGFRRELDQVMEFLAALTEAVELSRRHVAIVPGNHDINRDACNAYFLRQSSHERQPVAPYWPKWEHFSAAFEQFYEGVDGVSFTPDEPWTLFEMPALKVVVAGLNSTMAESHLNADHYGWVGEPQLRWFADRLAGYRDRGWLRLGAVHHNAVRGAVLDEENLRDADDLDRWLGRDQLLNLLLHGHAHHGRPSRLSSGVLALSTGTAAVTAGARPQEVPNRYQLLTVHPGGVKRHARQYDMTQRRWIGDIGTSPDGSDWYHNEPYPLRAVGATFANLPIPVPPTPQPSSPGDGFFDRVLEATRAAYPDATVTPRPAAGYLRVTQPLPGGGAEQWPVGVVDGEVTSENLESFMVVDRLFRPADPSVRSELVYGGPPATNELKAKARLQGVRLRSFVDYQGLVDLRPLVERQEQQLVTDPIYPTRLYVPQRYRLLDNDQARDDLLGQVIEWLGADSARFVMVLGDFGRGKTFLLRELARTLRQHLPSLLPVLVELRSLEKAPSLDELLVQHLVRHNVEVVDVEKLRYMIRSGRLALLFDGFDELEQRVGYDNAADYLQILLRAVTDRAKVVLTSRTQHFHSTAQIRTALGAQVTAQATSKVAVLEDFTEQQILRFLTQHYGQDDQRARSRFDLLARVHDLQGLSRNPQMLSFIASLDDGQLLAVVESGHGQISAAELYQTLVGSWLRREADRHRHRGGQPVLDAAARLAACTALALRLWAGTASTLPITDLTAEVSGTLTELSYTTDQLAHTVGSGTLLIRTEEGEFGFVHQSVMEWLVASSAAAALQNGDRADILAAKTMSRLMLDFLCDLAGQEVARRWSADTVADPAASEVAKQNALAISQRLGPGERQVLAGLDLRPLDLTDRDFRHADLRSTDLRGMRLRGTDFAGADLRGANLTGVRMFGGDLAGAHISDSQWKRTALLGVAGLGDLIHAPELAAAAVAGRDSADVMIAPTGDASSAAFSPDSTIVAVTRGHCVEIIDLTSADTLRVLRGHTGPLTGVAFSPDGTLLATTAEDNTARLWDPTTGQLRRTLQGHTGPVTGVAFSPDGALLATTAEDNTARLWDPTTGQLRRTLQGHTGPVTGVAFSPDGTLLATASWDNTARLWDPVTGQYRTILQGHTNLVTGVVFAPHGTRLATTSVDNTARLWDPATGRHHITLKGHKGTVRGVAFSPAEGSLVATTSHDRTARLWDSTTGQLRRTLKGHTDSVTGVAFSLDGTLLATTSWDNTARIWDPATGQLRRSLEGHTGAVTGVAFSPDGRLVATTSRDRTARLWDPATGHHRATLRDHTDTVRGVAFSPDGTLLATTSHDGTARLWDTPRGVGFLLPRHARMTLKGHLNWVTGVAFSPNGHLLATTSRDGTVRLWHLPHGEPGAILESHTDTVRGVAFSPDGSLIATTSHDRTARLWDSSTGTCLATLLALEADGYAVLLSDGSYKLNGDPGRHLWWAIKLCRFAPGELDPYYDAIRRLSAGAPIPR